MIFTTTTEDGGKLIVKNSKISGKQIVENGKIRRENRPTGVLVRSARGDPSQKEMGDERKLSRLPGIFGKIRKT